ncbi:MAG: hypothetical protein HYU66_16380 [Armatimonadetes bacterium]|nr:hypothetical protein [Armatimonadota bacterium]
MTDFETARAAIHALQPRFVDSLGGSDVFLRVEPGFEERIHVYVVSSAFEGRGHRWRSDHVWGVLEAGLLEDVLLRIGLLFKLTPEEYEELKPEAA